MFDEPNDLRPDDVSDALHAHWGFRAGHVSYAPVGFGSHHWLAGRDRGVPAWFVTGDRLTPGAQRTGDILTTIAATAQATYDLAGQGLDFVVAGLPTVDGRLVVAVNDHWAIQVFPYIDGATGEFGERLDPTGRRRVAEILSRLHSADAPPSLPRWQPALPQREALTAALCDLGRTWTSGPYAEPARAALAERRDAIERSLAQYDDLAQSVVATAANWVVSHGEPHGGNLIRAAGRMLLVDWDTVRLAPRERDLVNAFDEGHRQLSDDDAVAEYLDSRSVTLDDTAIALFRRWWGLADICAYTLHFRRPHGDGQDERVAWRAFTHHLPEG